MKRKREERRRRLRVQSVDRVERVGPNTYKVEATFVEDDRPAKGRGSHRVRAHRERVNGKTVWVREHEARDPG